MIPRPPVCTLTYTPYPSTTLVRTAEFSAHRPRVDTNAIRLGTTPRASMENLIDANFAMVSRPEMAAVLEIHLARRNDPDLDREVGPSTRRFDRRVRLWGH